MATALPVPNSDEDQERRLSIRRARTGGSSAGFGRGDLSTSESYRGETEDRDLRDQPVSRVTPVSNSVDIDEGDSPGQRMLDVSMVGDASYAKEYRLMLMHKMLQRGISLDNIARQLGVSISTAQKYRVELKAMLREKARSMDINHLVGDGIAFYDELIALSLRQVSAGAREDGTGGPTPAIRLAAMRTALAAKADSVRFLNSAGVFDALTFRRAEEGSDLSDVQSLMQAADRIFDRLEEEPETAPEPKASPRRIIRRARPAGGFKPLEFEDSGGSSGDNEVQEL